MPGLSNSTNTVNMRTSRGIVIACGCHMGHIPIKSCFLVSEEGPPHLVIAASGEPWSLKSSVFVECAVLCGTAEGGSWELDMV